MPLTFFSLFAQQPLDSSFDALLRSLEKKTKEEKENWANKYYCNLIACSSICFDYRIECRAKLAAQLFLLSLQLIALGKGNEKLLPSRTKRQNIFAGFNCEMCKLHNSRKTHFIRFVDARVVQHRKLISHFALQVHTGKSCCFCVIKLHFLCIASRAEPSHWCVGRSGIVFRKLFSSYTEKGQCKSHSWKL